MRSGYCTLKRVVSRVALTLATLLLSWAPPARADRATPEEFRHIDYLSQLSLEELLLVPISTPATLLSTQLRRTPGSVTILDQSHIRASGARDLGNTFDV